MSEGAKLILDEMERQLVFGALDSLGVTLSDHDHEWTEGERAIYEAAVECISKVQKSKSSLKEWLPCSACGEKPVHFDFIDASNGNRNCWIARPRRKSRCHGYKVGCDGVCQIVNYDSEEAARKEWNTRL